LPLLPDAVLSVAEVHALVASEPNASASNTQTAEKMRDIVMISLLMNIRLDAARSDDLPLSVTCQVTERPHAECSIAMHDLTPAGADLFRRQSDLSPSFFRQRCGDRLGRQAEHAIRPQIRNATLQSRVIRCLCVPKPV
jgi:hypothetical protein